VKLLDRLIAAALPPLVSAVGKAVDANMPKIIDGIKVELEKWLPTIVETIVVAMAHSAGQITVDSVDKVTDIIPGQLDDQIIDGLVGNILGSLGRR
jgi:hypothetical protein